MFDDIKNSNYWKSIELISKGWSKDTKYYITTMDEQHFLLRISDIAQYEVKKKEYEIIKKYSMLGIHMSMPIDFGTCNDGNNVYMLLTWIEGNDLEDVLSELSEREQYQLGRKAGEILKRIHSIKIDSSDRPIETKKSKNFCSCHAMKNHKLELLAMMLR